MEGVPAPRAAAPVAPQPHAAQPQHLAQPQLNHPHVPPAPRAPLPAAPQYRPAQGGLDAQGRIAPQSRMMDDDQLEIPAFLRRQAN
jgi:cell division protein FtsZ